MLINEPAVLVPHRLVAGLLALAVPEVRRRQAAGAPISAEVWRLLGELQALGSERNQAATTSPQVTGFLGSDARTERFRAPIVDGVTVNAASKRLGISPEMVRRRCRNGTLRADRDRRGAWIIDLEERL